MIDKEKCDKHFHEFLKDKKYDHSTKNITIKIVKIIIGEEYKQVNGSISSQFPHSKDAVDIYGLDLLSKWEDSNTMFNKPI